MKKNITTKPTNRLLKFTAILLAFVTIVGAAFFVMEYCSPADSFLKPSSWLQPAAPQEPSDPNDPTKDPTEPNDSTKDPTKDPLESDKELADGSFQIGDVVTAEGVSLHMTKLAAEDYEDYGVSAQAESAITLTIKVEPDYATNKTFDWTFRFKDSSDDFITGTNDQGRPQQYPLSDFLTLRVASDTLSAVAECKRDFWKQIEVVATYRANPYIQVSCACDYIQRMKDGGYFRTQSGSKVDMTNFKLPSNPDNYASYQVYAGELTNGTVLLDVEWGTLEMTLNTGIFMNLMNVIEFKQLDDETLCLDSDWMLQFFIEGERTADKYSKMKAAYDAACARDSSNINKGVEFWRNYTLKRNGEVVRSGSVYFEVGINFAANTILDANMDKGHVEF